MTQTVQQRRKAEATSPGGSRPWGGKKLSSHVFDGERFVLYADSPGFPAWLVDAPHPPKMLYGIGNPSCLRQGLAVIGARKATPYGLACARKFAYMAAERGIVVISGGALGCDSQAHRAALDAGGETVVVLGGGCDYSYPAANRPLFQKVIDSGGALISEYPWDYPPIRYTFRERNRIIAGLSKATLIVEAGLPSGTFSTADDALESNRDVLVVPGSITSPTSRGSNRLIYQGAIPVVDEESFEDILVSLFGCMRIQEVRQRAVKKTTSKLLTALNANPLRFEEMLALKLVAPKKTDELTALTLELTQLERDGLIARFPDGRYGPAKI